MTLNCLFICRLILISQVFTLINIFVYDEFENYVFKIYLRGTYAWLIGAVIIPI